MKQISKLMVLSAAALMTVVSVQAQVNTLTKKEKKQGWQLLFDGKTFDGWRQCNGETMPANWVIEEDAMKVFTASGKSKGSGAGGDVLYFKKEYKNFELSIDWKAEKAANSGIFYYVREVPGKPIYYAAPEVQVLDNKDASDNKIESHLAGSLYDILPADPAAVNPAGEWNTCVIKVKNGKAEHWMNGKKVVTYELWTPQWDEMVANSKFKNFEGWKEGIAKQGYIGLQDHGYDVWFRNIKIRELK